MWESVESGSICVEVLWVYVKCLTKPTREKKKQEKEKGAERNFNVRAECLPTSLPDRPHPRPGAGLWAASGLPRRP